MKKLLLLLALLPFLSFAQVQIGQDLLGEAAGDLFGFGLSSSYDGTIIAIGASRNDGNGSNSGHVRVFKFDSGVWVQLGQDINGEAVEDRSGYSIALSENGYSIAICGVWNDTNGANSGNVRIFNYSNGNWTQKGNTIQGVNAGDQCGWSLDLSADGNTVVIGSPTNDDNGSNSGHVRVFKFNSNNWIQFGQTLVGDNIDDQFGEKVSMSQDANKIAIGAMYNDSNGSNSGHVKVYENVAGTWVQVGQDILGSATGENFGYSISMSNSGNVIAIAADSNLNGIDAGQVRVYELISGVWTQIGVEINGEAAYDHFGISTSLSSDGLLLSVGSSGNDTFANNSGHVKVYQNINGNWIQTGNTLYGQSSGDEMGYSKISKNNGQLLVGFRLSDSNGVDSGKARVYDISCLHSTTWDGVAWSNGKPTVTSSVTFTGNYSSTESINAGCNVTVTNNAQVIINNGHTLNVGGQVTVDSGSSLTIENNAALRQKKEVTNIGNIIVKRASSPMLRLD